MNWFVCATRCNPKKQSHLLVETKPAVQYPRRHCLSLMCSPAGGRRAQQLMTRTRAGRSELDLHSVYRSQFRSYNKSRDESPSYLGYLTRVKHTRKRLDTVSCVVSSLAQQIIVSKPLTNVLFVISFTAANLGYCMTYLSILMKIFFWLFQ